MSESLENVLSLSDRRERFQIKFEGKPLKPVQPELPGHDDLDAQRYWLTAVLHLDFDHPITGGTHSGMADGRGHVALDRFGAPTIHIKPASRIAKGENLSADLVWQLEPSDGPPYAWNNSQATRIARVVHWLCDASAAITSKQETAQILTTYIEAADEAEGNTYGNTGERYEAAVALRPELDGYGKVKTRRYLVDTTTPEIVIRVSDLAQVARSLLGSSIAHGWLDAQMAEFGWERVELQGQSISGRDGRVQGAHASCDVYRGAASSLYGNDEPVNA